MPPKRVKKGTIENVNLTTVASRKANESENSRLRPIKDFLDENTVIPETNEFQYLNEIDQRYHVMQFEDNEARQYTGETVEQNMNR